MNAPVELRKSHLCLKAELVEQVFNEIDHAYVGFAKEQRHLLVTPVNSVWFTKVYEPAQFLLKARNIAGDRSLAIHQILIDHGVDMDDRTLEYEWVEKTNLIKVRV